MDEEVAAVLGGGQRWCDAEDDAVAVVVVVVVVNEVVVVGDDISIFLRALLIFCSFANRARSVNEYSIGLSRRDRAGGVRLQGIITDGLQKPRHDLETVRHGLVDRVGAPGVPN